jgi:hypothetical protein
MSANPVTDNLMSRIDDQRLQGWVERWGRLERLAVDVYRRGRVGWWTQHLYRRLRRQLISEYANWKDALAGHWVNQTAGGRPLAADPFASLLAIEDAVDLVENWRALRLLPAARQALNEYLMARIERDGDQDRRVKTDRPADHRGHG